MNLGICTGNHYKLLWHKVSGVILPIYEDDDYSVTSTDSGEWGGTIYFKDKSTGITYEGSSICPVKVNKFEGKYYVTNFLGHFVGISSIYSIENPKNMDIYDGKRPQEYVDTRESNSFNGMTKVFDSEFSGIELISSFVKDGEMFYLYANNRLTNNVYIAKYENGDFKNIYKFDTKMSSIPWVKVSINDYHLLNFWTSKGNTNIIMEITPSKIHVHTIINK